MSAQRDRAWGRYYARKGLRIGRSDIEPIAEQRISSWAAKYFRLPADKRNPPTRITLPEITMTATVTNIFAKSPTLRSTIREQLAGCPEHKIIGAESRARKSIRQGIGEEAAVSRAVAWGRDSI